MATLRDIRNRISSVQNISKITSAMKMVAATKLRRAQSSMFAARPYSQRLADILSLLASQVDEIVSPLFQPRPRVRNIGLIVVSADRGLCGSFNTNLLKAAVNQYKNLQNEFPKAQIHIIAVGRRSCDFFGKRNYSIIEKFPGIFTKLDFSNAHTIAKLATDKFLLEDFDKVQLIYSEFKSVVRQETVVKDFLPIEPPESAKTHKHSDKTDYIFEPSQEQVLESLLPKHLNMQVWQSILESNAAEQAARMVAMDSATTNAKELIRTLSLSYNKARQASITKELLEIVSGAEALQKG